MKIEIDKSVSWTLNVSTQSHVRPTLKKKKGEIDDTFNFVIFTRIYNHFLFLIEKILVYLFGRC